MFVFLPTWLSSSASYSVKQPLSIALEYVYDIKYRFFFFKKMFSLLSLPEGKKIMTLTEIIGYY